MAAPIYKAKTDAGTLRRIDRNTLPFWIPYSGIISNTSTAKVIELVHSMCDIQGIDNPTIEFINEQTINALGKNTKTVNDGTRIGEFTATVRGNDVGTLMALVGENYLDVVSPDIYKDHGIKGVLVLLSFSLETGALERTDAIFDISVKVSEMPAGQVGSDTDQPVTLYSDDAFLYTLPSGYTINFEMLYDDGTGTDIVNTAAPDGAIVDFDLGDGNDSYATTINPAALAIEANALLTGYKQNFYKVLVDGVEQDASQVAYSITTTNHLVFTTAPADGAKLFMAYPIKLSDFDWANQRNDLNPARGAYSDWLTTLVATV